MLKYLQNYGYKAISKSLTVVIFLIISIQSNNAQQFTDEHFVQQTDRLLEAIQKDSLQPFNELISEEMMRVMGGQSLSDLWDMFVLQYGEIEEVGLSSIISKFESNIIVEKPIKFAEAAFNFRVTFDTIGMIQGVFLMSPGTTYRVPEYVRAEQFLEYKITFGKAPYELEGTLTLPKGKGPFPLVILVHGSGPIDQDASVGANKPFKDIAWGLASNDVAVFRYHKRTFSHMMVMMELKDHEKLTLKEETVDDAVWAIEVLSRHKSIDAKNIWVAGHSLGGMAAPLIAKATGKKVAGIILLAAPARPLPELLIEQLDYMYRISKDSSERNKARFANTIRLAQNAMQPNLPIDFPKDSLPFGVGAAYWRFLQSYNQVATAKLLKNQKVLVLQGATDYQVSEKDYNIWRNALGEKANGVLYAHINHLMMYEEAFSTPDSYKKTSNVWYPVIMDMATAVKKR